MCDIIYDTLSLIDLKNEEKLLNTLTNLEHLFEIIIPNVYFCRQCGKEIIWVIKSEDRGEYCRVIIGKNTFEVI